MSEANANGDFGSHAQYNLFDDTKVMETLAIARDLVLNHYISGLYAADEEGEERSPYLASDSSMGEGLVVDDDGTWRLASDSPVCYLCTVGAIRAASNHLTLNAFSDSMSPEDVQSDLEHRAVWRLQAAVDAEYAGRPEHWAASSGSGVGSGTSIEQWSDDVGADEVVSVMDRLLSDA